MIAYGNQWSFYDGTITGLLTVIGVSYKFYGMLLLGGVMLLELAQARLPAIDFPPLVALQRLLSGNRLTQ
ncbi:MAG: hypothetical protein HC822_04655 [Oscillochloris sp.]|nr:hypothetical protein [Oscillochloris sp.]